MLKIKFFKEIYIDFRVFGDYIYNPQYYFKSKI